MEQSPEQPIHWDSHRASYNLTLIFSLAVALIGLVTFAQGGDPLLFIMGLAVAAYSWFTTPKHYLIYAQALIIVYGRPRVKVFPFANISHVETLSLPVGERLRVRLVNGGRVFLTTKEPGVFRDRLDEALEKYNDASQTRGDSGEGSDRPPPY